MRMRSWSRLAGFVERVDDVGDDLTLGFHAVEIGDVEKADDDALRVRIAESILRNDIKPAPLAIGEDYNAMKSLRRLPRPVRQISGSWNGLHGCSQVRGLPSSSSEE